MAGGCGGDAARGGLSDHPGRRGRAGRPEGWTNMAPQTNMACMTDIISPPSDLGHAIKQARKRGGMKATEIARHSGRSRDVLNRLERGEDVTVASLMAILGAMGLVIKLG